MLLCSLSHGAASASTTAGALGRVEEWLDSGFETVKADILGKTASLQVRVLPRPPRHAWRIRTLLYDTARAKEKPQPLGRLRLCRR